MNDRHIEVKIKNVYGKELIYPVSDEAIKFCKLLKTQTLTREAIEGIKALRYTVVVNSEQVQL